MCWRDLGGAPGWLRAFTWGQWWHGAAEHVKQCRGALENLRWVHWWHVWDSTCSASDVVKARLIRWVSSFGRSANSTILTFWRNTDSCWRAIWSAVNNRWMGKQTGFKIMGRLASWVHQPPSSDICDQNMLTFNKQPSKPVQKIIRRLSIVLEIIFGKCEHINNALKQRNTFTGHVIHQALE